MENAGRHIHTGAADKGRFLRLAEASGKMLDQILFHIKFHILHKIPVHSGDDCQLVAFHLFLIELASCILDKLLRIARCPFCRFVTVGHPDIKVGIRRFNACCQLTEDALLLEYIHILAIAVIRKDVGIATDSSFIHSFIGCSLSLHHLVPEVFSVAFGLNCKIIVSHKLNLLCVNIFVFLLQAIGVSAVDVATLNEDVHHSLKRLIRIPLSLIPYEKNRVFLWM